MSGNVYVLLNALIDAGLITLKLRDLKDRVAVEASKGTPPEELVAKIKQWRDEAVAETDAKLGS